MNSRRDNPGRRWAGALLILLALPLLSAAGTLEAAVVGMTMAWCGLLLAGKEGL